MEQVKNTQSDGPELAKFLIAFKNKCPITCIRAIAHQEQQ